MKNFQARLWAHQKNYNMLHKTYGAHKCFCSALFIKNTVVSLVYKQRKILKLHNFPLSRQQFVKN